MDSKDLVMLGIIVGLGYIVGTKLLKTNYTDKGANLLGKQTKEIITQGAQNGWRYFDDGTSISPDGTYYKGNEMIYDPQAEYRTSF